jgi:signal transduction histidine kinase
VQAAGNPYDIGNRIALPARTTDLEVAYTALSLAMPDRVRFRYRLVGADTAWTEAGNRREAFYTNLRPGSYRFQVIAANEDGVWNESGAGVDVEISPTFTQTRMFPFLIGAAIFGSVWLLALWRRRQITRAEEALGQLRSELAHVSRVTSLGALTAAIAHEVNQPLTGIVTNAGTCLHMLAAHPPNVDGARETARRLIRDGNRAADVIARLRALFSGKPPIVEPFDLNEAVHEVIALSRSELQRGRALVQLELVEDLPPATGDRVQLQQVIINLLRNACDAMSSINDRPREIVIQTGCGKDDDIYLSVRDSGVGLAPEGAENLFQAFHTTKREGMGIGLSVSRSIIESHQGRLWAIPNDGPGVTFCFSIPRRPDENLVAPAPHGLAAVRPTQDETR